MSKMQDDWSNYFEQSIDGRTIPEKEISYNEFIKENNGIQYIDAVPVFVDYPERCYDKVDPLSQM